MEASSYMHCVLKVDTKSPGWHKTLTKLLKSIQGVVYTIDAIEGWAYISGKIDPYVLLKKLAKAGKHAQLCQVDSSYIPNNNINHHHLNGTGHVSYNQPQSHNHQVHYSHYYDHHPISYDFSKPESSSLKFAADKNPNKCCLM